MAEHWIGAAEAARRLGVKNATLYAYVSRGLLSRRHGDDGRSLFEPAEIERLARRGRPRRQRAPSEFVIESAITALSDGRPYYRGRDALELAASHSFESVAQWLWTGTWDDPAATGAPGGSHTVRPVTRAASGCPRDAAGTHGGDAGTAAATWRAEPQSVAAGRAAQSALPAETLPRERLQVITAAVAATDPLRLNLDPPAVVAAGQNLIASMVDCLPGTTSGATVADRLAGKLTRAPLAPALRDAVRTALVLLADHELAASTLAARVAASARADPYAVAAAGLGALAGPLHGGASLGAQALLAEIAEPGQASRVVAQRLRRGERIPGFGHTVYTIDRRATYLLDRIRAAVAGHPRLAAAEAVLADARRRRMPSPNIDFALATLAETAQMISGAGEAIFAVARTAGWLAHALEQYGDPALLRVRAVYTGPAPRR